MSQDVEKELQEMMSKKSIKEQIAKIAKEQNVDYKLAETMFRSSLKQMLENKDFWKDFTVEKHSNGSVKQT